MQEPSRFLPEQASTWAPRADALFVAILVVTAFFSALIFALIFYFAVKFRRRHDSERGGLVREARWLELTWTIVPLVIALGIFVWGAALFVDHARPPADAVDVYVVGRQWMWKVQHPDGAREINELHVPVGQAVRLVLASEDVIHSFFVPAFRIKRDVLPGRYSYAWFQATKPGEYHLFCAEYCGTGHSMMVGRIVVMEARQYERWLEARAGGSLAAEGERVAQRLGCLTCHQGEDGERGPALAGLFGKRVRFAGGDTGIADEAYVRESILAPAARVVVGYEAIMPTYQGLVSEEEVLQLVGYVRSLRRAQSP